MLLNKRTIDDIQSIKVSMFSSCRSNMPEDASLVQVLLAIIEGKRYSSQIATLRTLISSNDNEGAQKFKTSSIPAFTASGIFNGGRTKEHLLEYISVIVLDIEDLELGQLETVFKQIIEIPFTLCAFRSPNANGIKIFIKTDCLDPRLHERAYQQVSHHYSSILKVNFEPSGKDFTRLCIVSADPHGYMNKTAQLYILDAETANDDVLHFNRQYSRAIQWTNRNNTFKEGIGKNFIYRLAFMCRKRGLDKHAVEGRIIEDYLSKYDYEESGIRALVNSAYSNKTIGTLENVADGVHVAGVVQHKLTKKFSFKSFRDLAEWGRTLEPKKKLFGNYILEKSTVIFPSERGVGKSLLAMQLAIVIAKGEKSYLNEDIELNGNVIYINLELSVDTVAMRLGQLENKFTDQSQEFKAYCLTARHGLLSLLAEIRELCLNKKPVLLIIDNLRTAFSGADNEKNKEMTMAMGIINQLKDEIGASLLIVHHTKKGTSNKLTNSDMQSGAGALTDLVDSDFFLRRTGADKNHRLLIRKKSRDAEEQEGAKLITLNAETLWFEFVEDNVNEGKYVFAEGNSKSTEELKSEAVNLKDAGLTYAEIGRKLGRDRSCVKRWFD